MVHGQGKVKCAPLAWLAFERKLSFQKLRHFSRNGQTQSGTAMGPCRAGVNLCKGFKNTVSVFPGNARSAIHDAKLDAIIFFIGRYFYVADGREFGRIGNQVHERLTGLGFIGIDSLILQGLICPHPHVQGLLLSLNV